MNNLMKNFQFFIYRVMRGHGSKILYMDMRGILIMKEEENHESVT